MVKIEEVKDAAFADEHDSDYTTDDEDVLDDVSEVSSVSDVGDLEDETLLDRFYALKDIVAPSARMEISRRYETTAEWVKTGGKWAGNAVWVITTSALLVGLPLALAIEDEARIVSQEKEYQMQQSGQQALLGAPQGGQQGLVPPGF